MAEKALQKVEDQLHCIICLDTYTDPKQLQCNHVFCRKCLVKLVDRDQHGQLILTCPICRQLTPVPANGVAGLQSAFHIDHILEMTREVKKAILSARKVEKDSTSLAPRDKIKVVCPEHGGKEVELYCETCEETICSKCGLRGGKHYSHDYRELKEAFEKYKVEITASLEPMEKQLTVIKGSLSQLEACCGEISEQRAAVEADIHKTFGQLHQVLDVRKTKLIGQLHQMTQWKLKNLAVQKDQIETTLAQLSSCLGFIRESLETGSQGEVLMMKQMIVKQTKELTTTFPPDMLKPITGADMAFSASADITTACQNYGQVSSPNSPDPSHCRVTGRGIEVAVVGETSTAVLEAINFRDQPCKEPLGSLECELVSEITGSRRRGIVERRGESHYEISYQPTIKGRHQLHIKVEGQHIRGSPFSVAAKSPVEKLGTPIQTLRGMGGPWGVAINQRAQEVVVTECGADCVFVFSVSGEKLRSFGTPGSGEGQLKYPRGVAVDAEGNILVADNENHRIQKFTAEGQFLTAVGTKGSGPLQFSHPRGITFNNKVYVTDSNNHRIQVLNSDLTFSSTFGKYGSGKGQFSYAWGIACGSSGEVYVADYNNHRIQVFTAEGRFLRMFGRRGKGKGELKGPIGIDIDSSGMVYVSEWANHRVSMFTSEGGFVTSFGSRGEQPGQFKYPHGLCVDSSGVVYVCDVDNHRIQML